MQPLMHAYIKRYALKTRMYIALHGKQRQSTAMLLFTLNMGVCVRQQKIEKRSFSQRLLNGG